MSRYFALGSDGIMYDLCDCGDIEAAQESATDLLPIGVEELWIADEDTALAWMQRIITGLSEGVKHFMQLEKDGIIT